MNPANLALRFLLELAALGGFAAWSWQSASGWWRPALAVLSIAVVMTAWTVFAVPGDPSRSGNAPVQVAGALRLLLELAILFGGAVAWHMAGHMGGGIAMAVLVIAHYAIGFERIIWLLRQ